MLDWIDWFSLMVGAALAFAVAASSDIDSRRYNLFLSLNIACCVAAIVAWEFAHA
jgi:hypothetical protein